MVLASVPQQIMHLYRNGILIGCSTISTGSKGHATPAGVFTMLEKKQSHFSKKYDNAPMLIMQRFPIRACIDRVQMSLSLQSK
jgi:hypothetical protein